MAIARACVSHPVGFDIRNLAGAVLDARRGPVPGGPAVAAFERAFAAHVGAGSCVAHAFARSAVHSALRSQDLPEGSEVIMPPITIKPMVDAVLSLGLVPVFVDLDPDTLLFDLAAFDAALTKRTRAVLLTYLFGLAADPRDLVARARTAGLFVVEDFSHDLGASVDGHPLGRFGDVGVYSCSMTKTLDAYGGGLAVTDDPELAQRLRTARDALPPGDPARLRSKVAQTLVLNIGSRRAAWTLVGFPIIRAVRRLAPEREAALAGPRSHEPTGGLAPEAFEQMTPRQARAGLALLSTVASGDDRRRANAEVLEAAYRQIGARHPVGSRGGTPVYWQSVVYVDDVAAAQAAMARDRVDTATTNLPLVAELGVYPEHDRPCPVARRVREHALYVPAHARLTPRQLARVSRAVVRRLGPLVAPQSNV